MANFVPPVPGGSEFDDTVVQQWMEAVRKQINQPAYNAQTTDPGVAGVPSGTWGIWLNTTTGTLKLWANQAGVMKSVTLT